jgi:hypothetical protein
MLGPPPAERKLNDPATPHFSTQSREGKQRRKETNARISPLAFAVFASFAPLRF